MKFSATYKGTGAYWVNAFARKCPDKFYWCSGTFLPTRDSLDQNLWSPKQPNFLPFQDCMALALGYDSPLTLLTKENEYGINDWECHESINYMCEPPQ
jgi:hypothetical protein